MRVLLLTNNVGKIFDALDVGLDWWLDILDNTITSTAADFIAVHLQELGGSAFAVSYTHLTLPTILLV